jgi:hypothetical protein
MGGLPAVRLHMRRFLLKESRNSAKRFCFRMGRDHVATQFNAMNKPALRPETDTLQSDQRLLECLGGACGLGKDSGCAQLSESEWEAVALSAAKHGLRPLLYERLAFNTSLVKVPDKVLAPLREAFLTNGLRNALLYRDLEQVVGAFRQKGLPVIVLKGAHLAPTVYQIIASRPMADIDLLVKPNDLEKAAVTLLENGYSFEVEPGRIETWRLQHPGSHHLPSFSKPPHPRLELHWVISAPPLSVEAPDVWQEARLANLAGVEARVLSPEDLLIHLCLHARLHQFSQGLRPVCDLSAALHHYQSKLDWSKVIRRSNAWHAQRCVYVGLWLGKQLMRAPVPDCVLRALQPNGWEARWAALAVEIVLAGAELAPETAYALCLADPRLRWGRAASLSGKLRFLGRKLFPGRHHMSRYMAEKHSLPLSPLRTYTCYLTRALDLLGVGVRLAGQRVLRGQISASARRVRWNGWLEGAPSCLPHLPSHATERFAMPSLTARHPNCFPLGSARTPFHEEYHLDHSTEAPAANP